MLIFRGSGLFSFADGDKFKVNVKMMAANHRVDAHHIPMLPSEDIKVVEEENSQPLLVLNI